MKSRRRRTSNQRWNNVVYVNLEIYNVQQRWNNVVCFNIELNNVRQCRNNVVTFNVDFHNIVQRRSIVANMTIWKIKPRFKNNNIFELQRICWTQNLLHIFPIFRGISKGIFAEPRKFLKHRICWITKSIFKPSHLVDVSWFLTSKGKFRHIMIITVLILYISLNVLENRDATF